MFNPLASVLWPGNLVQGESLASGVPTSIPVTKRQPGNISLAIVSSGSAGATMYRTVDKMQQSYVNQAMNEILSGFSGNGFAQYSFNMDFLKASEELEYKLNANFAGWGASAKAGFNFNSLDNKTRVLIKLYQSYYTMTYDDPQGLDGVFTPDITVNDLRDYTGNGNPICYISSVTYGRIYYVLYESTASEDSLRAALNASYKGFGVTAGVDLSAKFHNTMEKTDSRVFQIGGDAEGGISTGMSLDLNAIRAFIEKGANFDARNTGAPISYTVKYLKNAKLVRMNNAMEYEIDDCTTKATPNVCPELPQLTTNDVITVTATTATLGGYITLVGEPAYTERGVCYSANTQPPTIAHEKMNIEGTGTGNFSKTVNDLTANTKYYVRAYATNEEGTAYGEQKEFTTGGTPPVLTTNDVTVFTSTTATLGGYITFEGAPAYSECGVCYATTQNPTTYNNKTIVAGTGTGNFTADVTGLTAETMYYVRAYAINAEGTFYGDPQTSFTTKKIMPTLTTLPASNITTTSASLGGNITYEGYPAYTERGVCYALTEEPTINNDKKAMAGAGKTGSFSEVVTGLTEGKIYYVRAYATSPLDTEYGAQQNFTTSSLPVVSVGEQVGALTAGVAGTVSFPVMTSNIANGTYYPATVANLPTGVTVQGGQVTINNNVGTLTLSGTTGTTAGTYSNLTLTIDGIQSAAFTLTISAPVPPTLTTNAVTELSATTATFNGYVSYEGMPEYTEKGFVYSTSTTPTTTASNSTKKEVPGSGTGNISASISGLTPNTTYYVRAYAISSDGTFYGDQRSFSTEKLVTYYETSATDDVSMKGVDLRWTIPSGFNKEILKAEGYTIITINVTFDCKPNGITGSECRVKLYDQSGSVEWANEKYGMSVGSGWATKKLNLDISLDDYTNTFYVDFVKSGLLDWTLGSRTVTVTAK